MTVRPYHHGGLRTALLAQAEATLREVGSGEVSLRKLAREIGVSHGAPRRHFPDKAALLDALAVEGFRRLRQTVETAVAGDTTGYADRMADMAQAYVRFATDNGALLELMFTAKHASGASAELAAAVSGAFEGVHRLMVEGQAAGELRAGDPERLGLVLFATLQGVTALANAGLIPAEETEALTTEAVRLLTPDP